MIVLYLIPGTGCTLTVEEWIIVGGWTVLGVIFYAVSKKQYKKEFGCIDMSAE